MLEFPSFIRGPVEAGYSRDETPRFGTSQPASGAYYSEIVSDDAPMFFSVNFVLTRDEAAGFRAWLRLNNYEILTGGQFKILLSTEDGITEQVASFTPNGIPQLSSESGRVVNYSGEILVQRFNEPSLGSEDLVLGALELGGRSLLDTIVNIDMPRI
jgi:hypothetical protein